MNGKRTAASEPKVPDDVRKALAAAPSAKKRWDDLTPIARWDFISWVDSVKQAQTRKEHIERLCSMLVAGKRRPCCFSVVPFDLYRALGANPKAKARWGDLDAIARRKVIARITAAKETQTRRRRIEELCASLTSANRRKE